MVSVMLGPVQLAAERMSGSDHADVRLHNPKLCKSTRLAAV